MRLSFRPLGGGWITLASTLYNVERDEDRLRLSNSAFSQLEKAASKVDLEEMPKSFLKHALDLFCIDLWEEVVSKAEGEMMAGDETKRVQELVKGLVVDGGGTIMFAPPGRNKTTTMLVMAVCLDAGLSLRGVFDAPR